MIFQQPRHLRCPIISLFSWRTRMKSRRVKSHSLQPQHRRTKPRAARPSLTPVLVLSITPRHLSNFQHPVGLRLPQMESLGSLLLWIFPDYLRTRLPSSSSEPRRQRSQVPLPHNRHRNSFSPPFRTRASRVAMVVLPRRQKMGLRHSRKTCLNNHHQFFQKHQGSHSELRRSLGTANKARI